MARYTNTKVTKDENKSVFKRNTTYYNSIPEEDTDIHVITQWGDRLDNLANQFYGNQDLWWFIGITNNINTMNIEPGTRLRISMNISLADDIFDKSA